MSVNSQPILVTGTAGFIGFHLAKRLLRAGHSIIGIDNLNPYYEVNLKRARLDELHNISNFRQYLADLSDYACIDKIVRDLNPSHIIHLAAQAGVRHSINNPQSYISSNIEGFLSILEACRHHKVKHFIYASSSSVYGDSQLTPFIESQDVSYPVSLYAATKRSNELMAQSYSKLYDIPSSGIRFFTVYGPWGRPDMAYFRFTKAILEGETIEVYNNGAMSRDFTYIDDAVEAIIRLIDIPPAQNEFGRHEIYNIGNNNPVVLEDFIDEIGLAVGKQVSKVYLPMQAGDVTQTYANIDKITSLLGFSPKTSLAYGIREFVKWYRAYYRL